MEREALRRPRTLKARAALCRRLRPDPGRLHEPLQAAKFALRDLARRIEQLEQVFLNVLVNAWHAMPGGGTLTIEACTTPDLQVHLCFRDTGIGMSHEVLERVFEPFYSTKGERGTGLGLAICKQILDHHQGTIQLESTPGLGTTVTIKLPQADITALSPPVFPSSAG